MKQLLFLSAVFFTTMLPARNYYIAVKGNNANDGLTPATAWQNIEKLNSASGNLLPGDSVFFKKGNLFYGTILINKSGKSGYPIVISSYGSGPKPIITGFTTIGGWTNEGRGIYSKKIDAITRSNMVTIDGVQYAMGRYPDATYLSYEGFDQNKSITDNQVKDLPDWTGAEIVIRKNDWTIDRCLVNSQVDNKISYTSKGSNQNASAGFGYFIQNDLRTLTTFGEWFHDTASGKFYMYFGSVDPSTKEVKVATLNYLLYNSGQDYITVDNISFTGSIDNLVQFTGGTDYFSLQNCDISLAGEVGVKLSAGTGNIISNNSITACNRTGIFCDGRLATITNNAISNIGTLTGQVLGAGGYEGIYTPGYGNTITYNTIRNIGYNGISLRYTGGVTVQYNLIESVCTVLDDGAGIYTSSPNKDVRTIDHNIILNVVGNSSGTKDNNPLSAGIYLDEVATNVTVTDNTIANIPYAGIKIHKANNNIISGNTSFNNAFGIDFEDNNENKINNNILKSNIFFAKATTQYALRFLTGTNNINAFGTGIDNYYIRPADDNFVFVLDQPSTGRVYKSLEGWKTLASQDAQSKKSPVSVKDINDIRFEYNATKVTRSISLTEKYTGVDGKIYSGTISLQPFTSLILIRAGR